VSTAEPILKVYIKRRPRKDAAPGEAPLTPAAEAFVSKISKSVGSLLECPIVQKRKPKKGTGALAAASRQVRVSLITRLGLAGEGEASSREAL
jgi:hypothetical protein